MSSELPVSNSFYKWGHWILRRQSFLSSVSQLVVVAELQVESKSHRSMIVFFLYIHHLQEEPVQAEYCSRNMDLEKEQSSGIFVLRENRNWAWIGKKKMAITWIPTICQTRNLFKSFQKVYAKQMFITKISQNDYYRYLISAADFRNQASRNEVCTWTGKSMIIIPFGRGGYSEDI